MVENLRESNSSVFTDADQDDEDTKALRAKINQLLNIDDPSTE